MAHLIRCQHGHSRPSEAASSYQQFPAANITAPSVLAETLGPECPCSATVVSMCPAEVWILRYSREVFENVRLDIDWDVRSLGVHAGEIDHPGFFKPLMNFYC